MRIIRKASKKPVNFSRISSLRKRSFAKRNFAKVEVSQSMLDAIEEAMEDALSYNHLHEPYIDSDVEVRLQNDEDYSDRGVLSLNNFVEIADYLAIGGSLDLSQGGEENSVTKAEIEKLNKEMERFYSAENIAEWLDWDVIAEQNQVNVSGDKLKKAWINYTLEDLLGEEEAVNIDESVNEALMEQEEQSYLADLYVDFKAEESYDTEPSVCEIYLGISDGRGTFKPVYHTKIRLSGNEAKDTQKIVKAIEHAGQCL